GDGFLFGALTNSRRSSPLLITLLICRGHETNSDRSQRPSLERCVDWNTSSRNDCCQFNLVLKNFSAVAVFANVAGCLCQHCQKPTPRRGETQLFGDLESARCVAKYLNRFNSRNLRK